MNHLPRGRSPNYKVCADGEQSGAEPTFPLRIASVRRNRYFHVHAAPAAEISDATKQPIPPSAYIGTGPYRFVEWKAGHEIILERFDKYVKRTDKHDGYAGERVAHFGLGD
ncbi:MAG: hypothetical protein HGA24_07510, partial [Candidatus Aminicenantes bacterium]|nr:hypothetical protein [Candidatus Aminicenantes bacterium]